uniref:Secreted protein n=1 Tax=Ascaris lumbricoides TaxID=6252 RepID=A0A0M3ILE0_ASCLU
MQCIRIVLDLLATSVAIGIASAYKCEPCKMNDKFRFDDINPNTNDLDVADSISVETGDRTTGKTPEPDMGTASKLFGRISNRSEVTNNDNGRGSKFTITTIISLHN